MDSKIVATLVAMAVVIGGVVVYVAQNDADGTNDPVTNGKMSVNLNYGTTWEVPRVVDAYNGAIALDRYLGNTPHVMDMSIQTTMGDYPAVNYQYGAITSINNIAASGDNVWNVFILNSSNSWERAADTLGWYKPFGDYDVSHRTANIAVIYGTQSDAQTKISSYTPSVTSAIVPVSDINNNEYFKATFYIKISQDASVLAALGSTTVQGTDTITPALINRGVYVTGYGSDLYLALKNAFPNGVSGQDAVPKMTSGGYDTVYSWIYTFLNLATIQVAGADTPNNYEDDRWAWWQQYAIFSVDQTGNVMGNTSDFSLGLYSTIDDAPLTTYSYALYFAIGSA